MLPIDDASPSSTNIYGDPVDGSVQGQHSEPQVAFDSIDSSHDDSSGLRSNSKEPEQFKSLSSSDQRFLKQLDADVATKAFSGEYYGAAVGFVICAIARRRYGLTLRPFGRGKMPERRALKEGTDYFNYALGASLVGRIVTVQQSWVYAGQRFEEDSARGARIITAFNCKEPKDAIMKYRRAWYDCQENMSTAASLRYRMYYNMANR